MKKSDNFTKSYKEKQCKLIEMLMLSWYKDPNPFWFNGGYIEKFKEQNNILNQLKSDSKERTNSDQ